MAATFNFPLFLPSFETADMFLSKLDPTSLSAFDFRGARECSLKGSIAFSSVSCTIFF